MKRGKRALVFALCAWVAGCEPRGPVAGHATIDAAAQPLRSAFNADIGRVRVIMLVAPT